MKRVYHRDRLGRFAASPGKRIVSALDEAERAMARAEDGVRDLAAARRVTVKRERRTVRRSALAGATVGALVPAPAGVSASAAAATAFAASTTAAGYKVGQGVGRARVAASRSSAAGRRIRR